MKSRMFFIAVALVATAHYAQGVAVLLNDLRQLTQSGTTIQWTQEGMSYPLESYHSEPGPGFYRYDNTVGIDVMDASGTIASQTSASQSSTITDSQIQASGDSRTRLIHPEEPYPSYWYGQSASIFGVEFQLTTPQAFHLEGDLLIGFCAGEGSDATPASLYLLGPSGNVFEYTGHQPEIDLTGILPPGDYLLYASARTGGSVYRGQYCEAEGSYNFRFSLHDVPDTGATWGLLALGLVGLRWTASLSRCQLPSIKRHQ